jgi:hypothetical protein
MRIQLKKFSEGRIKSSGTYAKEAFAKSRATSGVTARKRRTRLVLRAAAC